MPVLNAMKYLPESIPALRVAAAQWPQTEIIVMDNGSDDGSREWIEQQALSSVPLLTLPGRTIGTLRNEGARLAQGEYLSFLDADCVVRPDYFHRAVQALTETGAGAVGCYYSLPPHATRVEVAWDELHAPREAGFVHMLNAGNFMIRREAFDRAGGFDASLVTGEDAELGLRLERLGIGQYQAPGMVAVHIGNPTTSWQFFRKELWHARGMLGTARLQLMDKPLLMTLAHLALILLACFLLVGTTFSPLSLLATAALILVVPAAAIIYRSRGRRLRYPVTGLMLYLLYFTARVCALPLAVADAVAMNRRAKPLHQTQGAA
jgi:GT2 family glycosyltransferase